MRVVVVFYQRRKAPTYAAERWQSGVLGSVMAEDVVVPSASRLERKFIARQHVEWFQGEVEQAMREADDPTVIRIPNDDVRFNWRRQRAEFFKRRGNRALHGAQR
jgi:hypothetical protein